MSQDKTAGERLWLVDADGREVKLRLLNATAAGRFRVRRRGATIYVQFEYYERGSPRLNSKYVGHIEKGAS